MALLPILDSLPAYVAQQEGYFKAEGINVEIISVASAPERDQLIAAGEADGMINELVSTMFINKNDTQIQIVRVARTATEQDPVFRILASKTSGITDPAQLKGNQIGISEGTVIEYVTDRLLESAGISAGEVTKVAIPRISDRLALLGSDELSAAVLPDPLASLALQGGAVVVIDDTEEPEYGLSVISFKTETLEKKPDLIRAYLRAVEKAVDDINTNPGQYEGILREKGLVPDVLIASYQIPPFPTAAVPTEAQWEDALNWVVDNSLIPERLEYGDSISDQYLP
jgi:NitT/TauT family transport system substrate-binding protein